MENFTIALSNGTELKNLELNGNNFISREEISEETIGKYLYTAASPDPDLIVRTAGEQRLSNFLLWQAAYSEFYYTDTLWPDMNAEEIDKACEAFLARKRNFGALPSAE